MLMLYVSLLILFVNLVRIKTISFYLNWIYLLSYYSSLLANMKILLALAVLQLLPLPSLLAPGADHWEDWGQWGECSRSCGGGVAMKTRRCVTLRSDGGFSCVGPSTSYRSCNIQDCPEGSRDFREEQCAHFDGMDFQGKHYKWLPYYGGENPCELNCIPRGENFYYRHRMAVVDGTSCYPGRRDICVDGVCKRLGCDNMLESPLEEDPCLQCGGNGQSCQLVKGTFSMHNLPTGYNQMVIIPVGSTTIRVREIVATRNYLAIKNLRNEYYLNGDWVIDYSGALPIAGTTFYYQRGTEGEMAPETITARGPTTEPLVIELISQGENRGVEYEYYLSQNHSREGYFWSYGSWSQCSKDCGSGYQSRLVFCAFDDEAYPDYLCAARPPPASNRTCNLQPCPQRRSWKMGEWSTCSASCGGGTQTRSVQCLSHDAVGSRVVEDSHCAAYLPEPLSHQSCNLQQCAEYSVTHWTQCSVTCGRGEQTRRVTCAGAGGLQLPDYACRGLSRPPHVQPCHMPACYHHISWHIGDWGLCSKSCGSGLRERQVICSDTERNLYTADRCDTRAKPPTLEPCNTQPCYSAQLVPSMQDPRGYDNTLHGFLPFIPETPTTVHRQEHRDTSHTNTVSDPLSGGSHCSQSYYGCCPDGYTHARGYNGEGCPQQDCRQSRYGCCEDDVSAAQGPNREGCMEFSVSRSLGNPPAPGELSEQCRSATFGCCYDRVTLASGPNGDGCHSSPFDAQRPPCSLPYTQGPCSDWTARYYYDLHTSTCLHFWYGSCHGNGNNFSTKEECERECHIQGQGEPRLVQVSGRRDSTPSHVRDMRRLFTVSRGSASGSRQEASAATQVHHHAHLPVPSKVQHTYPTASLGVSIDKSDPSSIEGRVGQTVILPCQVSPPPSSTVVVEWRKDGNAISHFRYQQQPNGSLLVGPLTLQDSGWVLCVATRGRERDHRYIYLSVSEESSPNMQSNSYKDGVESQGSVVIQPSIIQTPKQSSHRFSIDQSDPSLVEGRVGQRARLPCRLPHAASMRSVSISWSRDGQALNSFRHIQQPDGSLTISQLTADDSGIYTCTVSNHNHRDERQLQLKVLRDLRITTAPNNIQVSRGSTAQLPCVVSGDNVSIGWSRNGVLVQPDGRRIQVSLDGSLILNNVQPLDEGSYTCNAYTGTYSVSATAEVRVTKDLQSGLAAAGEGISLDCTDQPELANCDLIVYARLCSNQYYSSFCCASCARHA
ncbi:papilin isoform X3 [Brienomyrus brachyistius]|uniref:papilin isoform X3 n=1 Tax=Brienomyrus brachyistius TaxID=42636 RepID=UPI0020B37293|nr:papilin isoform X3 [Brienomyrus brachyistius]